MEERDSIFQSALSDKNRSYSREYSFDRVPLGLIERIVIRILQYPGFDIDKKICLSDDFVVHSSLFLVRVQSCPDNVLKITLGVSHSDVEDLSFFSHFLFESPSELLASYPLGGMIKQSELYYNGRSLGVLDVNLRRKLLSGSIECDSFPDIGLIDIPRLTVQEMKLVRPLARGAFGMFWLMEMNGERIVCKELLSSQDKAWKEFIHEVLMMSKIQCEELISLIGIQISCEQFTQQEFQFKGEPIRMKVNQPLMFIEYAPLGDLSGIHELLKEKPIELKLKIGLDLAQGLNAIHSSEGIRFIHLDVRSQNVFIFSVDERRIKEPGFYHAKLGDFGCLVIGSPTCGKPGENW